MRDWRAEFRAPTSNSNCPEHREPEKNAQISGYEQGREQGRTLQKVESRKGPATEIDQSKIQGLIYSVSFSGPGE
jgi:hypothetical protein